MNSKTSLTRRSSSIERQSLEDLVAGLYAEMATIRRGFEELTRQYGEREKEWKQRFDVLFRQYLGLAQQAAFRSTTPAAMSSSPLQQVFGLFDEVPLGNDEGYPKDELFLGGSYQESKP